MSTFVIADLHLAQTMNKPMDIFGSRWENHTQKIKENWQKTVSEQDTVVIAGDISWGMRIEEAEADFRFLQELPGHKIVLKGNHDYWWQTMKKLLEFRDRVGAFSVDFLFNNAYETDEFILCGTRGWTLEHVYSPDDQKIVDRETQRLRTSIREGKKLQEHSPDKELLVFLHYPPAYANLRLQSICEVLAEEKVGRVFYGHMHNADSSRLVRQIAGASSELIAADYIGFCPVKIEKK
ncbi:MAG: metallophosphoesterase [Clostridia bacterium]|nr:metallophosphoesterase [Clostridia bacterium]